MVLCTTAGHLLILGYRRLSVKSLFDRLTKNRWCDRRGIPDHHSAAKKREDNNSGWCDARQTKKRPLVAAAWISCVTAAWQLLDSQTVSWCHRCFSLIGYAMISGGSTVRRCSSRKKKQHARSYLVLCRATGSGREIAVGTEVAQEGFNRWYKRLHSS